MFDSEIPFDLLEPGSSRPEQESDQVRDRLIADLEWLPPGILLAAALSGIDRGSLSGEDRVSLLKARSRQIAHDQAELLADIEAVSGSVAELSNTTEEDMDHHDVFYTTASEISAALSLTRRASEVQTELAYTLCQRLPQVWKALSDGVIDLARARVLADQTTHLPEDLARKVCDQALERAPRQTTGQLRARIQRLILTIDPAAAVDRYQTRLEERKIVCESTDAGTANLHGFDLPADRANAAMCRVNRIAKKAKRKGDRRPIDQIRADIFLDLLCGEDNGQSAGNDRGVVDIRVPLTTLLGLAEDPGEVPGYGPVIADVARQVVTNSEKAEWRVGVTHLDQLIDLVTTRRRPTKAQRQLVETLQPECVFPTCRMPATECDLDHTLPWAQTHHTTVEELGPGCSHHHHHAKHGKWKLQRIGPGVYRWTSPLGHKYTTGPDPP